MRDSTPLLKHQTCTASKRRRRRRRQIGWMGPESGGGDIHTSTRRRDAHARKNWREPGEDKEKKLFASAASFASSLAFPGRGFFRQQERKRKNRASGRRRAVADCDLIKNDGILLPASSCALR